MEFARLIVSSQQVTEVKSNTCSQLIKFVVYSRGQAKPTNLVSQLGVHLAVRFFQILTQIVEMNQKTHLRSFSHDVLGMARILDQKQQHLE
jgi:hypothetical protein